MNISDISEDIRPAKLMIVSKNQSIEKIIECIKAGAGLFGENRAQEMIEKWSEIVGTYCNTSLHFIGHLQTNKVKDVCPLVDAIQSVDSLNLAHKIDQECQKLNKIMPIFLEVNITEEDQKYGFHSEEVEGALVKIKELKNIQVIGLMCLARFGAGETEIRDTFKKCKTLADQFNLPELSMGMTDDYQIALEEGSTLVRLGRKIFG